MNWVNLGFSDIDGVFRGKKIMQSKLDRSTEIGYCDVVFGWDLHDEVYPFDGPSRWDRGFPDAHATVDLDTKRVLPWNDQALYLLDFSADENFSHICPRSLLKKAISLLKRSGLKIKVGMEYEWFNFIKTATTSQIPENHTLTTGNYGYSPLRLDQQSAYVDDLLETLEKVGIDIEGFHTETGPGVYEAALQYGDPLEMADKALLFKYVTKVVASKHNILASFMAKWNERLPGCSGHIHFSLADGQRYLTDYSSENAEIIGHRFLQGVLQNIPTCLPLYAPFINSYKRLVPGSWAPTTVTYGVGNRTSAMRIVHSVDNKERLELRIGGSDANPYLTLYALIMSGIAGVNNPNMAFVPPLNGNAYENQLYEPLASDLKTSVSTMIEKHEKQEVLDLSFVQHYAQTRMQEWNKYNRAITDWELQRYLEII